MAKKKAHGGKRKGSGRKMAYPDEGRTIPVAAGVPSELVARLDAWAKANGCNRSKAITEAIRGLVDRKQ